MGQRTVEILCYADDAVLMPKNKNDLQRFLHKIQYADIAKKLINDDRERTDKM